MQAFLAETDYPALARTLAGWRSLPPADRVPTAELLSKHFAAVEAVPLRNNAELWVDPRPGGAAARTEDDCTKRTCQDVLILGGKAAWGLEELTGYDLPAFTTKLRGEEGFLQAAAVQMTCVRFYVAGLRQGAAGGGGKRP